ncbi:hypothetical protein M758_4G117100 [Ceratodon purpureus]|uniref:Uncharacterized protein n=1 Tax=Ceratodon purpureus TaxID=3225 RepID=A0A8T0I812_CERPU|nr:hypothetical protein KC19_4G117300 [Ceratodon purpureus]KAG0619104.1 hypothetical protein M758_4G117100 [Ceratodon purpureus]
MGPISNPPTSLWKDSFDVPVGWTTPPSVDIGGFWSNSSIEYRISELQKPKTCVHPDDHSVNLHVKRCCNSSTTSRRSYKTGSCNSTTQLMCRQSLLSNSQQ